jgi:hypothetical protein
MTTIQAPSMRDAVYQGAQGNKSIAEGQIVLKNAAAGDVIELLDMPMGMRITSLEIVSDALGAGVSIAVKAGDKTLVPAASHSAAVAKIIPIMTHSTLSQSEKISATIAGGSATGRLIVNVNYIATGY